MSARADEWIVRSAHEHADCEAVRLEGSGIANAGVIRTLLRPFDEVDAVRSDRRVRPVSKRVWNRRVAGAILSTHPFGGLHAAAGAAFDLHPYQLEPALAMLRHARLRVLIADQVGLGKTVQAAIVLGELAARVDEFRALIVTPAGLREQWRRELAERFGLESTLADTAWLVQAERTLPRGVNPWSLPAIYVTSLDLVKRPEVLRGLHDLTWDLVVVDEAHGSAPGTARLKAARMVASRARRVVLLTATPPEAEPEHLSALYDLGRSHEEAPITVFRRSRADVGVRTRRRSVLLSVRLSTAEREMHRALDRYTALVWREARGRSDHRAKLAAVVLRKRALSSAASLARSVRRRLALLGGPATPIEQQLSLPLLDEDPLDDTVSDDVIGVAGLSDTAFERDLLEAIADRADRAAARQSKLRALLRMLRRLHEPAIVFTEYRDTLQEIAASVPSSRAPLLLHGGMTSRERDLASREFARSGSLLLATDAASEGLNLHHRCRLVVHFELPWTVTRLEQRTGRVDRIGQSRRVHEIVLVARHTAERLVLGPLLRRVRAASLSSRAWAVPGESKVAAAVMDGVEIPMLPGAMGPVATTLDLSAEGAAECARLGLHRSIGGARQGSYTAQGPWIHITRGRRRLRVVVLVSLRDASGRVVHGEIVPLELAVAHGASPGKQGATLWADAFLGDNTDALLRAACASGEAARKGARDRFEGLAAALLQREARVAAAIEPRQMVVQAGLFDRRALDRARDRRELAARLADDRAGRERLLERGALRLDARILAIRS